MGWKKEDGSAIVRFRWAACTWRQAGLGLELGLRTGLDRSLVRVAGWTGSGPDRVGPGSAG